MESTRELPLCILCRLVDQGRHAADPQTFKTEESSTKFCHAGNVVWFNPDSKIYFEGGSRFYGNTKAGGFTCRAFAEKSGFRASKGN